MILGEVEVVCPLDGKTFKTVMAASGTQFGSYLDLKPFGPTPAPWPMAKCPGSGLVIYKNNFSNDEVSKLRQLVLSPQYQAVVNVHTNYFLAARLMAEMGEPPATVASTLLQATWEARSPAEYRSYATAALASYEQVLLTQPQGESQRLIATLVAGELERRLGLFEQSKIRFLGISSRDALPPPMNRIVKLQLALLEKMNSAPARVPAE
jgi:hypothetical protein